jgi:hypothetical protein
VKEVTMKAFAIIIVLVIIGVVGALVGYWVGHALGWTTDAEFPLGIGGGARAIGLSILVSFASVMAGIGLLIARPLGRIRRLAATGAAGHATIRRVRRTGLVMTRRGDLPRHEVDFEVEMHPDGGRDYIAHGTGLLTEAEESVLTPGVEAEVRYDETAPNSVVVIGPMATA